MNKEEIIERLVELQKQEFTRMSYYDIEPLIKSRRINPTAAQINIIDKYMNRFVKLDKPHTCLLCGGNDYSWGLQHGSAYCTCGWEYRLYHYIEDEEGNNLTGGRIEMALQYHPDSYSVAEQ